MSFGNRLRRPRPLGLWVAVAALAVAANGAVAEGARGLVANAAPPPFFDLPANPLIEALRALRPAGSPPAALRPEDLGAFQNLARADARAPQVAPDAGPAWTPAPIIVTAPAVAAAPASEDKSVRRRALPSVRPYPANNPSISVKYGSGVYIYTRK